MQTGVLYFITQEDRVRIYSELGFNILFPNAAFSDKKKITGMHGVIDLDSFTFSRGNFGLVYFVEVGYSVNPAKAEKLEGSLTMQTGQWLLRDSGFISDGSHQTSKYQEIGQE